MPLQQRSFDRMPRTHRCRVFGVEYVRRDFRDGGQMFFTRYGWAVRSHLELEQWYENRRYLRVGRKLPGGTGSVFRVPTVNRKGIQRDLVVKFSRLAQEVPILIYEGMHELVSQESLDHARFNGPFEEFGHLMQIRRGPKAPEIRIMTKRPLAIFVNPVAFEPWQLGRTRSRFNPYRRMFDTLDDNALEINEVHLDIHHEYVTLYEFVHGQNAQELYDEGLLTEAQLRELTLESARQLKAKGYQVLDHKPKHLILRKRSGNGALLERQGRLVWALVDFELLVPINFGQRGPGG